MFYDKEIEIWNMTDGHKDEDNIWIQGKLQYIKDIMADVQPYSAELLKRDYGLEAEVTKRIFSDLDSEIAIGTILVYKNIAYEVKKIIEWDDYMELMCAEIETVINNES